LIKNNRGDRNIIPSIFFPETLIRVAVKSTSIMGISSTEYSFFKQNSSLLKLFFTSAREFLCRLRKFFCSSVEKKFKVQNQAGKIMASVFWDNEGILVMEFLKRGA
jgi:hypothetical protein